VLKAEADCQEAVIDTGCTSDLSGKARWRKFKAGMSAKDQAKVVSTEGTKTYNFGDGEAVKSLRKVSFHTYVAGTRVNFCVDIIPGDLPFLISLKTMREREFIINCERDTVSLRGKTGMVIAPVRVGDNGHH
jgi:hypothetical protein